MKLKGKNVDRIPKVKRDKMEKTLQKMEEVRQIDSNRLRDIIKAKKAWAIAEKVKASKYIVDTNIQIERLNGILLFCQDLMDPVEKE